MTESSIPGPEAPHLFLPDGTVHVVGPRPEDIPELSFRERLHYAMTNPAAPREPIPVLPARISEDGEGQPIPMVKSVEVNKCLLAARGLRELADENWQANAAQREADAGFRHYLGEQVEARFGLLTAEEREAPAVKEFEAELEALREAQREAAGGLGFTTDGERQAVAFHRDTAKEVKKQLGPNPTSAPYSPIANFHLTQRATMADIDAYKIAKHAEGGTGPRARTSLQERASLRQNGRAAAIIKYGYIRERFISLYGPILDDREALDQELASGRHTRKQMRAMRKASRLVRSAKRSIDRINGRLNNSINGVDIPGILLQGRSMDWRVYPPYDRDERQP